MTPADDIASIGLATPQRGWKYDRWEAATGVLVIIIIVCGNLFKGPILTWAQQTVALTVVCELCMVGPLFARAFAGDGGLASRLFSIIIGAAAYMALIGGMLWKTHAFYIIPQALSIFWGRLRPRDNTTLFSQENSRRFAVTTLAGVCLVIAQVFLIAFLTVGFDVMGWARDYGDGAMGPPMWVYGILWGGFYIEMAFLLPSVEALVKKNPALMTN